MKIRRVSYLAAIFCYALSCPILTRAQAPDGAEANTPDAIYYNAVKAEMTGDNKQAITLFSQFVKDRPDEAAAYYELARLYCNDNSFELAQENIKKAVKLDDNNKWYKEQYAVILAGLNKYEEAADIIEALAASEMRNESYYLNAALLYQRAGKYKLALANLDKVIAKGDNDDNEELLIQKEQIYLKLNDVDNAARVINALIEHNPKEGRYYTLLGEIYDNNNQPDKAADIYKKADQSLPGDPAIQLGWAEHYQKLKDTAGYNLYITKAIVNSNQDLETQLALLGSYLQSLSTNDARKADGLILTSKLLTQHPENAQLQAIYGDILMMNGRHADATEAYKKAITIDPSKFQAWQQLLISYTDKKDADSLVKYSQKAIKLFPNQAIVNYMNGIGEMNLKNYPAAIRAINRAIDMQPEDNPQLLGEMYSLLGDIYHTMKQYTLSDSSFAKALQYDPDNATVLNNYSYYLSERGQWLDDAERMSKKALQLRPGEATFLDTYGWVLYKYGKYDKAKIYIQQAIDSNPQNADATLFEHLGNIYYKLDDKDKAVEYWKKAKQKGSDNPQIDKEIQERKLYE